MFKSEKKSDNLLLQLENGIFLKVFNRELVSAVLKVCLLGIPHFYFSEVSTFQMVSNHFKWFQIVSNGFK